MLLQQNFAQSFQSPIVRVFLVVIAVGLLYVLWREVRKIPAKLLVLMATAFIDMLGVLMIFPLLPFYVKTLGGPGINIFGFHLGIGIIAGFIIASFTLAQLLSAPLWGKFSDRVGRRPTLLIALSASAVAYLIFGFADSLFLLFLSRIVQGAGGGTVGVIQAYVADSTAPNKSRFISRPSVGLGKHRAIASTALDGELLAALNTSATFATRSSWSPDSPV